MKQLCEFLRDKGYADLFDAVSKRQEELKLCLDLFPGKDVKDIAEKINIMKKARVFPPYQELVADIKAFEKGDRPQFEATLKGLLDGTVVPVEGLDDKPVLLQATKPEIISKAEALLRFIHNHKDKKLETLRTLTENFVREKKISLAEIRNCKVNGVDLTNYVKDTINKGLDVSVMKTDAREKFISAVDAVIENNEQALLKESLKALEDKGAEIIRNDVAEKAAAKAAAEAARIKAGVDAALRERAVAEAAAAEAARAVKKAPTEDPGVLKSAMALGARLFRAGMPGFIADAVVGAAPEIPADTPGVGKAGGSKGASKR